MGNICPNFVFYETPADVKLYMLQIVFIYSSASLSVCIKYSFLVHLIFYNIMSGLKKRIM